MKDNFVEGEWWLKNNTIEGHKMNNKKEKLKETNLLVFKTFRRWHYVRGCWKHALHPSKATRITYAPCNHP
jgi:hypothetical protein